jgi:hypothetical protein
MQQAVNTQTKCLFIDSAIIAQPKQYVAGVHTLSGEADTSSQPLLRAASRVARVKIAVRGVLPQKLVCNFYCRYVIYKCGRGTPVRSRRCAVSTSLLCIVQSFEWCGKGEERIGKAMERSCRGLV